MGPSWVLSDSDWGVSSLRSTFVHSRKGYEDLAVDMATRAHRTLLQRRRLQQVVAESAALHRRSGGGGGSGGGSAPGG